MMAECARERSKVIQFNWDCGRDKVKANDQGKERFEAAALVIKYGTSVRRVS
jgi:hypothetical protein